MPGLFDMIGLQNSLGAKGLFGNLAENWQKYNNPQAYWQQRQQAFENALALSRLELALRPPGDPPRSSAGARADIGTGPVPRPRPAAAGAAGAGPAAASAVAPAVPPPAAGPDAAVSPQVVARPPGAMRPVIGYALERLGGRLTPGEIESLSRMIRSGAPFAKGISNSLEAWSKHARAATENPRTPRLAAMVTIASRNLANNLKDAGISMEPDDLARSILEPAGERADADQQA